MTQPFKPAAALAASRKAVEDRGFWYWPAEALIH
jgi:hypothetical protein